MIYLEPSSIFDFYTPQNLVSKITNLSRATTSTATSSSNANIGGSPSVSSSTPNCVSEGSSSMSNSPIKTPKNGNTWVYWVVGAIVVGGGIYLIHRHYKKEEEKENKCRI